MEREGRRGTGVSDPRAPARQVTVVFLGLALAMFLASLDQTIVATALPVIAGELGGLDHLSWIIIAYHLHVGVDDAVVGQGQAISTAASGCSGRRGRGVPGRFGAVRCGGGRSGELIAFRACQGVGAGGMITLAMAVIADVVPPRERGRYQGYIQLLFTLSSVVGPLLGGSLADALSWRWVFYVNLPVGAVALAILVTRLRLPATRTERTVDYPGAALLVGGVVCLLLVTESVARRYTWGLLAAGLVSLAVFVWWERRTAEPILPPRLFRRPVFLVVAVTLFLTTCMLFAVLIFTPLFLQIVVGASAASSGLLLLPMTVGITLSTILSGRLIARTGRYQHFPVIGLAITTVTVFLLSRLSAGSSS